MIAECSQAVSKCNWFDKSNCAETVLFISKLMTHRVLGDMMHFVHVHIVSSSHSSPTPYPVCPLNKSKPLSIRITAIGGVASY